MLNLIRSRLSYKVAIAASALTLFFVVVTGAAAYVVMSALIRGQAQTLLASEAALRAEKLSHLLDGVTDTLRARAASSNLAVRDLSQVNGVPLKVTSDSQAADNADPWVAELVAQSASGARIAVDRLLGPTIMAVEPLTAGGAKGALIYRIALRDLGKHASISNGGAGALLVGDVRGRHSVDLDAALTAKHELVSESPVRLPAIFNGLTMVVRLAGTPADLDAPLAQLTAYFLAIGAAATLLVVLVSLLIGRKLTAPLRRLSDVSTRYGLGVGSGADFRIGGNDEISRLGAAFAGVIERLDYAYRDLELRNQTLLSNAERVAQVGSAGWNLTSGRHLWSSQFHAILGLDPDDVQPGLSAFFDRVHPDDRPRLSAALDAVVADDVRLTEDFRIVRADGEERVAQLRGQLARGDDGEPARVDLTLQDITERKQMEARFDSLVRELRRSNEELEQFAYVASHDLRQPLRVVGSYVTLIEEMLESRLDPETHEFMDFIRDGVRRMDLLITDLLAYSRVGRTSKDGPVDTGRALDMALLDLQVDIDDAGARIIHPTKMPVVLGDASEMARLFQNLIGNGVKYRATDRTPVVEIGCADNGTAWEFFVRDNGIGIPPEHKERVFGIFQRLHARDEYEGTGIGLAICKKVVERQGGKMWIESGGGQGTTFRFTWPKLRRVQETAIAE